MSLSVHLVEEIEGLRLPEDPEFLPEEIVVPGFVQSCMEVVRPDEEGRGSPIPEVGVGLTFSVSMLSAVIRLRL
jgi:hypothetical protein